MTKTTAVLWLTLLATLAASWTHLTTLFARHEWPGWWPVAALAATAVDLGILASMLAIADLARDGRDTSDPRWTVAGLVLLSCLANAAHVLAVSATGSGAELALAVVVAASLPLIVWRLSLLLDGLRRPVESVTEAAPIVAPEPAPPAATVPELVVHQVPARKVQRKPARKRTTNPRHVVIQVAAANPMASQRELARISGASPTTVAKMIDDGQLRKNGHGWEVAAEGMGG